MDVSIERLDVTIRPMEMSQTVSIGEPLLPLRVEDTERTSSSLALVEIHGELLDSEESV